MQEYANQKLVTQNQNPLVMMVIGDALAQESFAQRTGTIYVLKLDTSKFYFNASKVH